MESNKTVQINWGTFNVPTLLSVLGILWYTATHQATQDSRIGVIEDSRSASKVEYTKRIEALEAKAGKQDNIEYRLTSLEQKVDGNNRAINARVDRQTDALQGIRDTLGTLSANVLVISNKIDNALPIKKSELDLPPPEYSGRN